MRFRVPVGWAAFAVVEVEAGSHDEAEEKAIDSGLPWDAAVEAEDGGATYFGPAVSEDEEPQQFASLDDYVQHRPGGGQLQRLMDDPRSPAMILAGLRAIQWYLENGMESRYGSRWEHIMSIAEVNGDNLSPEDIDELCEAINGSFLGEAR